jgi:hypothetical protein
MNYVVLQSDHTSYPITGLDRPLGFQEVETPRISRQSAHEGGKAVSPMHWPSLPPGMTQEIPKIQQLTRHRNNNKTHCGR